MRPRMIRIEKKAKWCALSVKSTTSVSDYLIPPSFYFSLLPSSALKYRSSASHQFRISLDFTSVTQNDLYPYEKKKKRIEMMKQQAEEGTGKKTAVHFLIACACTKRQSSDAIRSGQGRGSADGSGQWSMMKKGLVSSSWIYLPPSHDMSFPRLAESWAPILQFRNFQIGNDSFLHSSKLSTRQCWSWDVKTQTWSHSWHDPQNPHWRWRTTIQ